MASDNFLDSIPTTWPLESRFTEVMTNCAELVSDVKLSVEATSLELLSSLGV